MTSHSKSAPMLALITSLLSVSLVGCDADGELITLPSDNRTPGSVALGPDQEGVWTTLPDLMTINPIHAVLLHENITLAEREDLGAPIGKVLVISGSGDYEQQETDLSQVWDFSAGTVRNERVAHDAFCSGITIPADGNPVVVGGTRYNGGLPNGISDVAVFKVSKGKYRAIEPMAQERWYPTATLLGDNRIMVDAGWMEYGIMNTTVEIYTEGVGWSEQYPMGFTPMFYQRKHLLPDGKVFASGPENITRMFDPAVVSTTNTGWTEVDWNQFSHTPGQWNREYGTSVMLPLTPENGYNPRVLIMGGFREAPTATTEIIDLGEQDPEWQWGPDMSGPRVRMQGTLLPNGKVLALGGSSVDQEETFATLTVDLYDPDTNTFSPAGTMEYPHLDHSVSLLLPDATVWVTGSQYDIPNFEQHMEVYQPAYLFNPNGSLATRPVIDQAPQRIAYGEPFHVRTDEDGEIGSIILHRAGAVTHSFDTDQRQVGLEFTLGPTPGTLEVTGPPHANIAPPGYYMLFLVTDDGVPSVATFVQLH